MSFGFSVGDFVAALELVGTVVNALRASGGSGSEYRELVNQLYSLETALLRVKQLELEEEQRSEYIALRQSASQCQRTIDEFWEKTKKYQKHLRTEGSSSKLKDGWMKIKWAKCKQGDLIRFKADLAAHSQSISIILSALQVNENKNQDRKRSTDYRTISATIQDATFQWLGKLAELATSVAAGVLIGHEILQSTAIIMATNVKVFQAVCCIQNIITRIPSQVERQQPVYMIDALGRSSPFYLEFIRSKEALQAVLKLNFDKIPSGSRKIDNGEFALLETTSKREIDLSKDWDACLMPGQRLEMRMIFERQTRRLNSCPGCGHESEAHAEAHIDCVKCGVTYRRIIQIEEPPTDPKAEPRKKGVKDLREVASALSYNTKSPEVLGPHRPPKTAYDEEQDLKYYRRVNIVHRQRRAVWEINTIPGLPREPAAQMIEPREENVSEERYYGDDSSDEEDLTALGESVDLNTFEQFLDMDEDAVEREFSRALILGSLEEQEEIIRRISNELNNNKIDTSQIASLAHWLKGSSNTIGLLGVSRPALGIQEVAKDTSKPIGERLNRIKELTSAVMEAFAEAKGKLRAFYGEDPEEVTW